MHAITILQEFSMDSGGMSLASFMIPGTVPDGRRWCDISCSLAKIPAVCGQVPTRLLCAHILALGCVKNFFWSYKALPYPKS